MTKNSVFIIGAGGMVGAATANALALQEIAKNIVLVDIAKDLVHGQALDISHATGYSDGVQVRAGDYEDITPNDIVVITAGTGQRTDGQSRLDLLGTNARIITGIIEQVTPHNPAFVVVVSNPVDILTQLAWEASGYPRVRIFGTGTALDTARLRVMLSNQLGVAQSQIDAFVLGEHGDSSFVALSGVRIGGVPLADFPGYTAGLTSNIHEDVRKAASKIIAGKRSTFFGIAQVVSRIVDALLSPGGAILPLSLITQGEYGLHDVAIGLPALVNDQGAKILEHYPLNAQELKYLEHSASVLMGVMAEYKSSTKLR